MVPHLSVKAIVAALRSLLAGYPWGGGGGTLPSARNGIIHARAPSLASVRGIRSDPGAGIVHARSGFTASLLGVAEQRHVGIIYATPGFSATVRGTAEKPGALVVHTRSGFSASLLGTAKRTGKVTAQRGSRGSVFGTKVDAVPSAPVLQGTAANGRHDLNWNIPNGNGAPVTSYILYRDLFTGSNSATYNVGNVTSKTDLTVQNGVEYSWIVVAYNQYNNHSGGSNNIFLTFTAQVPATPVLSGTFGNTTTDLTWPTPSSPGSPLQAYTLKRNGAVVSPAPAANSNSYHDTGLNNGTQYTYVLIANNAGGASQPSNSVVLVPQAPAVGVPADILSTIGTTKTVSWGANTFTDTTAWTPRGFWGYTADIPSPYVGGGGYDFTGASSAGPTLPNNRYNLQWYIEQDFNPGADGAEGFIKTHVRDLANLNKTVAVGSPPVNWNRPVLEWWDDNKLAAFVGWFQRLGQFETWFGHGIIGFGSDTETGEWSNSFYNNVTQLPDAHTDKQNWDRKMKWWHDAAVAYYTANPNAVTLVYDWVPKGGAPAAFVYTNQPPEGPGFAGGKHWLWVAWAQGMADVPNLGPNARLICINAFFYQSTNAGGVSGADAFYYETQGAYGSFANVPQSPYDATPAFSQVRWDKIADKIKFSFFQWPGSDMSQHAPVTVSLNKATGVFTSTRTDTDGTGMFNESASRNYCLVQNAAALGLTPDYDYWIDTVFNGPIGGTVTFHISASRNGPPITFGSGTVNVTIEQFNIHTSYYVMDTADFAAQQVLARQYGMGTRRAIYDFNGSPPQFTKLDFWHNDPNATPANNLYTPKALPANWRGGPYGNYTPSIRTSAGRNSSTGAVDNTPMDTTAPTIRHPSTGTLDQAQVTNNGNGTYRVSFRLWHAHGGMTGIVFNKSRNPSLTKSPGSSTWHWAKPTWNQNGGTKANPIWRNPHPTGAYQLCTVDIAATSGEVGIITGYSIHDQAHSIQITFP